MIGPSKVLVRHSATQPYNHILGPADQFFAAFQTATNQAWLPQAGWGVAAISTPIFCGLRTTKGGSPQIVRVCSGAVAGNGGSLSELYIGVMISKWRGPAWVLTGASGSPGDPAGIGFGLISVPIIRPASTVLVLSGSANPQDSSEVDIQVILNGQPSTIQFHVTEVPSSPEAQVGVAVDQAALGRLFDPFPNFTLMHGYVWPFTGKQPSP